MHIRVLASKVYNESLLILLGLILGIIVGGTATIAILVASLDFGPGDVQAQATIQAGLIQGIMTLAAGCVAILAAAIAYLGVIRQVSLSESQHNARVNAYKIKIRIATNNLYIRTVISARIGEKKLRDYRKTLGRHRMIVPVFDEPAEFSENDWEHHALLGEGVVQEIDNCRTKLRELISFQKEVMEEELDVDDISNNPKMFTIYRLRMRRGESPISILENASEDERKHITETYMGEMVIEENVTRTLEFFQCIDRLLFLIKPEHKTASVTMQEEYLSKSKRKS